MRRHHRNRLIFALILILIATGIFLLVRFISNRVSERREADTNVRIVHIDLSAEHENSATSAQGEAVGDDMQVEEQVPEPPLPEPPIPEPTQDPYRTYNDHIDDEGYTQLNDYEGVVRTEDIDVLKANLAIYAEKDPRANKLLELPVDSTESIRYSLLRLAGNNPMTIGPVLDILEEDDAIQGSENQTQNGQGSSLSNDQPDPILDMGESIELNRPAPFFLQWDKRWAADDYGTSFLMLNGCVPVSLSMALSGVTGEFISPVEVISHAGPDDVGPWGTAWAFVDRLPGVYGVGVTNLAYDQASVNQALDEGKIILVSIGPGPFTFVGHFIVIVDYDEEGYIVNDPNSLENTLRKWSFEEITPVSNLWAIG